MAVRILAMVPTVTMTMERVTGGRSFHRESGYSNNHEQHALSSQLSQHRGDDSTNEELLFQGRNYCFPPPPKIHPSSTSIFALSSGMNVLA